MGERFSIPTPERPPPRPEFQPVTIPPLVDQDPVDWPEPEEFELVSSSSLDELVSRDDIEGAREIVLNDPRVTDALGGDRPIGIDPSVIEPKQPDQPILLVFLLYSCASSSTVEVTIDASTMDIVSVETGAVQPPLTRDELDTATQLAAQELGLTYGPELVGRAMGIIIDDSSHHLYGHRLADVRIGNPEYRLPRYFAIVDLCEGSVVDAGDVG